MFWIFLMVVPIRAYDAPDFSADLFSGDGIFLAEDEKTSLLEALAAIASNFPSSSRVDDDLREKALALALRIDPLHASSRAAHRELSSGAKPKATAYFDSLSTVSETLWGLGSRLAEPPLDPEEARLAPFLLELSLVTHPAPPDDRLAAFALACGGDSPKWDEVAKLDRATNPSTDRALSIFRESTDALREQKKAAKVTPPIALDNPVAMPTPPDRPKKPDAPDPFSPISVNLETVSLVEGVETIHAAGTILLLVRPPAGGGERDFLAERLAAGSRFPLLSSDEGIPVEAIEVPAAVAGSWTWPKGTLGEVRFDPVTAPPGPRRLLRTKALLPSLVLIECALAKKIPNESFVLLGELDPVTLLTSLPTDPIAAIEAGRTTGRPYLLVPASVLEPLVVYLQKSSRLDLLLRKELVSYDSFADALALLTAPTDPALVAASAIFDEIEEASARLSLPELARFPSAQEKLKTLLTTCPDHLSARAMLEYGLRPVTAEMRLVQFGAKVDAVVAPFLYLEESSDGLDGVDELLEAAGLQFLKLRPEAPVEARDLLGSAEDLVEAADLYLQFTNKDSSIAIQRLREAREAIVVFEVERSKLGLVSNDN